MLRRASYAGFTFEVSNSNLNFGRRTVVHEFPQRNDAYVEDMGKSNNKITVTGFIIGADYLERSKALIDKLNESEVSEFPALLIHPWLGELWVYPVEKPVINWTTAKRIATFTLVFVEAKPPMTESSSGFKFLSDAVYSLRQYADKMYDEVMTDTQFNLLRDHIDDVQGIANTIFSQIKESRFGKTVGLAENFDLQIKQFWNSVESNSRSLAKSHILTAVGVVGLAGVATDWSAIALLSVSQSSSSSIAGNASTIASGTSSAKAQQAFKTSMRLTMLGNALGSVSYIPTESNVNADNTVNQVSDDELLSLRDYLLASLENEMIIQGTDDENMYETLSDSYSTVYHAFKQIIGNGANSEKISLPESEPALVLAYDRYADAGRSEEIVTRNRVVNPLFLSTQPITVPKE